MKRNRAKADLMRSKSILIILKLLTIGKVPIKPPITKRLALRKDKNTAKMSKHVSTKE